VVSPSPPIRYYLLSKLVVSHTLILIPGYLFRNLLMLSFGLEPFGTFHNTSVEPLRHLLYHALKQMENVHAMENDPLSTLLFSPSRLLKLANIPVSVIYCAPF
jgi:hypothetical protein